MIRHRLFTYLTVATVNYFPYALVTLRSARRYSPGSHFCVFLVDAPPESVTQVKSTFAAEADWIQVFGPSDLGPERDEYMSLFAQYNAMELSCVAKFVALSHLLRSDDAGEVIVFVDSDTLFFGDAFGAIDDIQDQAVLLTPHLMRPSTDANEHDIMTHGWMNAGFVAVRRAHERTREMIDWVLDRASKRGYLAPQYGLSYDQKWVSALPVLFRDETSVSRHPGLNVGYWNISERPLAKTDRGIMAAGQPLLLFHFSGFDWPSLRKLSKHSPELVEANSALEDVCRAYRAALDDVSKEKSAVAKSLDRIPCSRASLLERIHRGSLRSGVRISMPTIELGLFARVGAKVDSLLRRARS